MNYEYHLDVMATADANRQLQAAVAKGWEPIAMSTDVIGSPLVRHTTILYRRPKP